MVTYLVISGNPKGFWKALRVLLKELMKYVQCDTCSCWDLKCLCRGYQQYFVVNA